MKKFSFVLMLLAIAWQSRSSDLQVYYYYAPFYNSTVGNYIETYFTVVGNSAVFVKNETGKYQATIEVTMLFNQDGVVKEFRKYNLKSPEVKDTLTKPNFIDLQRINLKEGNYNFEMKIKDLQSPGSKEFIFHDIIVVSHNVNEIVCSGIEFLEKYSVTQTENSLSRNGYDMVPYVADYYPSDMKNFTFYFEIYNTKAVLGIDQDFLLRYFIESTTLKEPINNFVSSKKQKTSDVVPILGEFSIDGLETGNYNFVVEVRNKENKVVAIKKSFFQRSNPKAKVNWEKLNEIIVEYTFVEDIKSKDSLKGSILEMYPISDVAERNYGVNVMNSDSLGLLQKYFFSFWKSRNNLQPEVEWKKYKAQVEYVNKMYGSQIKKGYESDRGRVYLQYGAPDGVTESKHEPAAYPYEIWRYYVLGNQRDRHFVFYSPELVGDDYILLHSDAFGEIFDKNWERKLSKRNNSLYNPNSTESDDQWGSKANEKYKE